MPFFRDALTAWFTPFNPSGGMLYRTLDGGLTWDEFPVPFDNASYYFLDLSMGYGLVSLGAGAGSHYVALYRTVDGGMTWTEVFSHEPGESKSLPESGTKNGITFSGVDYGWIGGTIPMTDYFYLHYTEDGGITWSLETDIALPETFSNVMLDVWQPIFINASTAYLPVRALGVDSDSYLLIYRSNDYGQTWTFQNFVEDGRAVDFISVEEGWIAGDLALYHTVDGGITWSSVPAAGIPAGTYFINIDFVDEQHGWTLTTPDNSTWEPLIFYRTTDGGANWEQLLP
ncbi:MAG: WD40/YVTN/BNR-like repeat-containing protein [Anaerolineales bacterium]